MKPPANMVESKAMFRASAAILGVQTGLKMHNMDQGHQIFGKGHWKYAV